VGQRNFLGDEEMPLRGWKNFLRASSALGLLVIATAQADAGGFAVREQSTYGQGASFAGIAAGGAPSSMFWNPATMTQFPGIQGESDVAGIIPYAAHTPAAGSLLSLGGTTNTGESALVPGSYFTYQINPNLWLGVSVNAPFGLSVSMPDLWAGRDYGARDSSLQTYNTTPTVAYRFSDMISVGVGVQIQYAKTTLNLGNLTLEGDGLGYGVTAGLTLTPTPTTVIGLGYRSAINQKINGSMTETGPAAPVSTNGSVSATVNLPDVVSLGIRQSLNSQFMLLGTVEWTNWSRIGTANVLQPSGAPAAVGPFAVRLPFQYQDGWFFSVGGEYQWSDRLTLRSGVGYEISPVTDQVRMAVIPDNDRFWLSVGASWKIARGFDVDLAYSHIWVRDPSINASAASGNPWFDGVTYIGDVSAHVDVLSIGVKYRWDEPAPAKKPLITK
jgi:long-chain fatty acid transport protein